MVEPRKSKVCQLQLSTIIQEYIRALDVPMDDTFMVQIRKASKHLLAQRLEVRLRKLKLGLRKNAGQVVVHVFEDHEHRA